MVQTALCTAERLGQVKCRPAGDSSVSIARRLVQVTSVAAAPMLIAIAAAPLSAADGTASLQHAVATARGGCPALQPNQELKDLAQRANLSTDSYVLFHARSQPIGSPKGDILPTLHQMGFNAGKAKMLTGYGDPDIAGTGYGDVEAEAIYGAILEGYSALPDCSYTRYGVDLLPNKAKGYALATVILTDG